MTYTPRVGDYVILSKIDDPLVEGSKNARFVWRVDPSGDEFHAVSWTGRNYIVAREEYDKVYEAQSELFFCDDGGIQLNSAQMDKARAILAASTAGMSLKPDFARYALQDSTPEAPAWDERSGYKLRPGHRQFLFRY